MIFVIIDTALRCVFQCGRCERNGSVIKRCKDTYIHVASGNHRVGRLTLTLYVFTNVYKRICSSNFGIHISYWTLKTVVHRSRIAQYTISNRIRPFVTPEDEERSVLHNFVNSKNKLTIDKVQNKEISAYMFQLEAILRCNRIDMS